MLTYVAKVDPGSVPHFLHKDSEGALVFEPTRAGAHEFESYAQASHVAHERGGYPVHVALFENEIEGALGETSETATELPDPVSEPGLEPEEPEPKP